nr:putative dsRNA-binding protein [Spiroplasma clarkii]
MVFGVGTGFNKKSAEQESAKNALSKIKKKL